MHNLDIRRVREILDGAKGKTVAVVGDVMLDRYFWGKVNRVSPEAPVPVIDYENETFHLGGAANVANNLLSLGISPILCGVLGEDKYAKKFKDICAEQNILSEGLFEDTGRLTTVKTRIIGNNQQIARLDRETRDVITSDVEEHILNTLAETDNLAGIVIEDYNKGTITEFLITETISFAKSKNIPVFVDPKFDHFFSYKGVQVLKPNMKEASKALNKELATRDDFEKAGKMLLEKLEADNILMTLSAQGMMLFESNGDISSVPTKARMVSDVSGAGDTAIATLATAMIGGANAKEAATIANLAAGVVCEHPGIVSIEPLDLFDSVVRNSMH
jgi:rfaE bifunctional protein kinase chain/domain